MIEILVSENDLSIDRCFETVKDPSAGGITVFVGTVRNQTKGKAVLKLDFEAYKRMAEKEMSKIADTIRTRWNALHVCMHHRVGELKIGEIPVIIAVSTPHRKESFEACQYAIDTLKETVPIWKKEFFDDGEIWVAAHP